MDIDELRSKVKNIFKRKKEDDNEFAFTGEEPALSTADGGDISFDDIDDPEEQAKTLKKKRILMVAGCVVGVAVVAVATSAILGGGKPKQDKPLSSATTVTNPAQALPDKYSDIAKYQKEKSAQDKPNPAVEQMNATATNPVHSQPLSRSNLTHSYPSTTSYQSQSTTRAMATPSTASNTTYSAPRNTAPTTNNAASTKSQSAAEKQREAIVQSALAFNVASDITNGKMPTANAMQTNSNNPLGTNNNHQITYLPPYQSNDGGYSYSYCLNAGTIIPATLLTGVTSDVPDGDVVAQIRQDVFDSLTGSHLLIPQGSRLIGTSGSAGDRGNKRIGVVFNRIIFPNGTSITLPEQKAIDGTGYPGLSDIYNEHKGSAYSSAFTTALLGALAQSATGDTSGSDTRSPGQEAVSGAVASILQTGQKFVEQDLNQSPTIEIQPGFQFSVFINQDLLIGEYHD